MKLRFRDRPLKGDELCLSLDPNKRQLVSWDINSEEAEKIFRDMPFAQVLITPSYYFFKQDES